MQQSLQLIHPQTFFKILPCRYLQNPNKIKQNPKSSSLNTLSYPISLKPTKIKHFSHFTTQKSNSHPTKIHPQIQNLPYLQALLPITIFTSKIATNHLSPHPPYTGGYSKTTHKTIKTVIALSYFIPKYTTTLSNTHISPNKPF